MDTLIAQLDKKYKQYLMNLDQSESLESSDWVFDCAYEYFCITENQPKIKEILEKDKQDLEWKKEMIRKQNESSETQKDFIENVEFRSLYFCYNEIFRDMYLPMTKYKNALNPLPQKEIIGSTELFREWFLNIMYFLARGVVKIFRLKIRRDVEANMALGKIVFNFRRKKYPKYMEQVHTLLIPQLLKIHTQNSVVESSKIHILVDSKKGIYQENHEELSYTIGRLSKRLKLIKYLASKDNCKISELQNITHQTKDSIMASITKINKLFRDKTGLTDDLIVHVDTGGYSLNKEIFKVEIIE